MVDVTTFTLRNVTTSTTYTIIDDADYGGLEFHYGSGGKQSPFRVVLPAFDSSLLDANPRAGTTNNGWAIRGGDEIEIRVQTPAESAAATVYTGVVRKVKPIVSEEKGRLLSVEGVSWGDHWLLGRVFEQDYRTTPTLISQVLNDVVGKTNGKIVVAAQSALALVFGVSDITIAKNFEACYCGKAVQEICAVTDIEYSVTAAKVLRVIPLGTDASGTTITETDIVGKPQFEWVDEDYHYDTVIVNSVNSMYAPNNDSPTGANWCENKKYWEVRNVSGGTLPGNTIITNFHREGGMVGGCYAGMALGYGGSGPRDSKVACTICSPPMNAGETVSGAWQGLGLIEADWDEFTFGFENNFDLTEFYVRLNHGKNGEGGYWFTTFNQIEQASKGVVTKFTLKMPSNPDVDVSFWSKSGTPTRVDEVQFIMITDSTDKVVLNTASPTRIFYTHFLKTPKAKTTVAAPGAVPRQLLVIDHTATDQDTIDAHATQELDRVTDSALIGSVTVDGSLVYIEGNTSNANHMRINPGTTFNLDIAYYGLNNVSVRADHIVHQSVNGRWYCTLAFGPFLQQDTFATYTGLLEILGATEDGELAAPRPAVAANAPASATTNRASDSPRRRFGR